MRFSFLPVIALAMPFLEIAGFITVGQAIGLWPTLGLILASSLIGLVILRAGGLGMVRDLQAAAQTGSQPTQELIAGALRVVAGILLILPGFITDIIGLALLIPVCRRILWACFGSHIVVSSSFKRSGGANTPSSPPVLDLDDKDFRRQDQNGSPWAGPKEDGDPPRS